MLIAPGILIGSLFIIAGAFLFLRIVGKEVHRRDKYLELRLHEKLEELKKQEAKAERAPAAAEAPEIIEAVEAA
jgi:hypothetical protein